LIIDARDVLGLWRAGGTFKGGVRVA
jgi:hypothetical protein